MSHPSVDALLKNEAKEVYRSVEDEATRFDQACYFLAQVTLTTYGYGASAFRVENFVSVLATSLGYRGVFHLTPNAIVLAFWEDAASAAQRVELLDYPGVSLDMSKLAAVEELALNVIDHKTSLEEALSRLEAIDRQPHPWGRAQFLASPLAIAIGVVPMFGGSWYDLLLAAPLSLLVGVLSVTASGDLLPVVAGMITALIATAFKATIIPGLDVYVVTLAAVMSLLPGLSITVGTAELAIGHHTLSGIVSVIDGVIYLVKLGGAAWFGSTLVSSLVEIPSNHAQCIDPVWIWIMFPIEIWGLCACTLMARRDLPWAALNCLIGYFGSEAGAALKDKNFGAFLGGILIFAFGNFWSRTTQRPAAIVIVPVMYYMVAATSAFHGIAEMTGNDAETGKKECMQMFVTAVMLEGGFLVGNGLVPQMKLAL